MNNRGFFFAPLAVFLAIGVVAVFFYTHRTTINKPVVHNQPVASTESK